jgi:hypothetical protein
MHNPHREPALRIRLRLCVICVAFVVVVSGRLFPDGLEMHPLLGNGLPV